jgi:acyl carrier protein
LIEVTGLSFGRFCRQLFALLEIDVNEEIACSTGLFDELGLDSLQAFELVLATEELADVAVSSSREAWSATCTDSSPSIFTLGDAFAYYEVLMRSKSMNAMNTNGSGEDLSNRDSKG